MPNSGFTSTRCTLAGIRARPTSTKHDVSGCEQANGQAVIGGASQLTIGVGVGWTDTHIYEMGGIYRSYTGIRGHSIYEALRYRGERGNTSRGEAKAPGIEQKGYRPLCRG
ncbi:unnamed protein product [Laminaria digitata]